MENVTPRRTYQDFEIYLQGGPDAFDATATGGDLAARDQLRYDWRADPVTERMLKELRYNPLGLDPSLLREFGHKLFDVLFPEEIRSLFYQLKDGALKTGQGLRLLLRIDDLGLSALPWEYLWDPRIEGFVAIDPETPLIRYVAPPEPLSPFAVEAPLRVLVVISNPGGYSETLTVPPLDVRAEQQSLQESLGALSSAGLVHLRFLHDEDQATPRAIRHLMREFRPHVFHFIGHGGYEERDDGPRQPFLILENEDQSPQRISGDEFRAFFVGFNETRLIILNACDTTHLVPRLVKEGVTAVVAMQWPIADKVAASFSAEFYRALAYNDSIGAAVSETRRAIYQDFRDLPGTWGFPALFLTNREGVVFNLRPPTPATEGSAEAGRQRDATEGSDRETKRGEQARPQELASIARTLAERGEIDRALEVTESIELADQKDDRAEGEDYRGQALAGIADAQAGRGDFVGALETAHRIENQDLQGQVMAYIIGQLAKTGEVSRAFEIAEDIGSENYRSQALAEIADAQASKGDFRAALNTAARVEDDDLRGQIRAHIAAELAKAGETDAALQVVEGIEGEERPRPPALPRVWFYMATGDDEDQVNRLAQRETLSWGANPNTRAGDLVLMYRTAPYSDFAYLFRAHSDAQEAQQTESWPWSHEIKLGDKVSLQRPVTLTEVRAHPRLADWNLAQIPRGAMRRADDIRAEGYWESLRGLLVAWNPALAAPLANWEHQSPSDLLAEALAVARGIRDEKERTGALSTLASYLSPSLPSGEEIVALLRNNRLPADEALPVLKLYLESNPDNIDAFLAASVDEGLSESQRWVALNAVLQTGHGEDVVLKPALRLLKDTQSQETRAELLNVLGNLGNGDPAAPARRVLAAGQSNTAEENLAAVYALTLVGTSAAVAALTEGLADGRITVHQAVVKALQDSERTQVTPALLATLGQRPQALEGLLSLLDPNRPEHEEVQNWLINLLEAQTATPSSVA